MSLGAYLGQPFAQHALVAGGLIAVTCGVIGPFVVARRMAFAVHGAAELSFTGAAAGLVVGVGALTGALVGSLVVALVIGILAVREAERDSSIGVVLAFGLGVGVYLLSLYRGFASAATNILFGQVFGISGGQLGLLAAVALGVLGVVAVVHRPLLFASFDPVAAQGRGVPMRAVRLVFLVALCLAVTEAAQVVGTLLVLSLTVTPAAAAQRLSPRPSVVVGLSVLLSLLAVEGGIVVSLAMPQVRASVLVTSFAFAGYALARLVGPSLMARSGRRG